MHAINNLCDVYEHRFKNQKYDLSDLDLLTLIQNTSTEEFDLLENQTPFPDFIEYLRVLILMHQNIKNEHLVPLTELQLDNFLNLYCLIRTLKERTLIMYSLINGIEDSYKNSFFTKALFPSLMNNTKTSLNDADTTILLDVSYMVYYGLINEHKEISLTFMYKLHELNPVFFSNPVMSNQEFINKLTMAQLLELDIYETIESLKINHEAISIDQNLEIDINNS